MNKTKGFVLKKQPFSEHDEILYVLTPDFGKIKVFVKGGRKKKSPLRGMFDSFSEFEFLLSPGRSFEKCLEAGIIRTYRIKDDYDAIVCALYFCEIVYCVFPFFYPDEGIYRILSRLFMAIENGERIRLIPSGFYFILKNAGVAPVVDRCWVCGSREDIRRFDFEGGGKCRSCFGEDYLELTLETSRFFRALPYVKIEPLKRSFTAEVFKEAEYVLRTWTEYRTSVSLNTFKLINWL